jgi:hypothetical protein
MKNQKNFYALSYETEGVVSTYNIGTISFIINYSDTSAFCMHGLHDTTYDTPIVK